MKKIIVNADDFGLTDRTNKAIVECFEKGIITDTTLLANCEGFDNAVNLYFKKNLKGKVGIHFNITEGTPLTESIKNNSRFCTNGVFHEKFNRNKKFSKKDKEDVYLELKAQAQRIIDSNLVIEHADSHHHVHNIPAVFKIVVRLCKEFGIEKLRIFRNVGKISLVKKVGKSYFNRKIKRLQFISTDYFGSFNDVKDGVKVGITEIMVHPDYMSSGVLVDVNNYEGEENSGPDIHFVDDCIKGLGELVGYKDLVRG